MIWGFLMGMVAGAVGWHIFVTIVGEYLMKKERMKAFKGGKKKDE